MIVSSRHAMEMPGGLRPAGMFAGADGELDLIRRLATKLGRPVTADDLEPFRVDTPKKRAAARQAMIAPPTRRPGMHSAAAVKPVATSKPGATYDRARHLAERQRLQALQAEALADCRRAGALQAQEGAKLIAEQARAREAKESSDRQMRCLYGTPAQRREAVTETQLIAEARNKRLEADRAEVRALQYRLGGR